MRICLDAREVREITTGIGRYSLNLVQHIARLDPENEYIVLQRPACREPFVDQDNFRTIVVPYGISHILNVIGGASAINPLQADIYHALHHFLPFDVSAGRIVITLHDLIWVTHARLAYESRWLSQLRRRTAGPFVGRSALAADHIIAISESTRQAATSYYGLPDAKFTVIHHGVDPAFRRDLPPPSLPEACVGKRFIFSLGNTKPYKNIPRLLEAFSRIARSYPDLFLVVSGRGDTYPTIARLGGDLGIAERIILTGQLSDLEVRACFLSAVFFAFPSLIEGFGIPVLEAMASGCPVLTSNASSLPEIVGDAALLVDPFDVDGMASGMRQFLEDDALRRDLARKGRDRAARFTWEACAEKTLGVYDRLMGESPASWPSPEPALQASQRAS